MFLSYLQTYAKLHKFANKMFLKMDDGNNILKAKKATRWIFFVCGLGISSWAPMVPFAKDRLGLNDADLGLLLLLLGFGAMIMMPIAGVMMSKMGSRKVVAIGTLVTAFFLPLLLIIPSYAGMAIALFVFGSGIGMVDVGMNSHGVQVQNLFGRSIMSSLHGLFSVGGLFGSLGLGFLMTVGLNPLYASLVISVMLIILLMSQYKNLFNNKFERETIEKHTKIEKNIKEGNHFQWFNKSVLLLGFMCFSVFLSEGVMLDWSAVFLRELKNVPSEFAGVGYGSFSIAMAIMRLTGDKIVEKFNSKIIVLSGCFIASIGLILAIVSPLLPVVLFGFVLMGVGASNIVPIFFSEGGRIKGVSPAIVIPAITTMGYTGQLAGPAFVGYVAYRFSIETAFGLIAFLMLLVAILYHFRKVK
ncbi:MAG: MFS transporter [Sphingobacterium sp.]|jgi:MFS family permease|nr:MFS transporter [Sphingobacterium sp.]